MMTKLFVIILGFAGMGVAQPWSGIISSSRAIDWSHAGLPTSYPDGETTTNPWTPPTRTRCNCTGANCTGGILTPSGNASTDRTNIQNAINACTAGHYVELGSGAFLFNNRIDLNVSGVSLRGQGPMLTSMRATTNTIIGMGGAGGTNSCTWSTNLAAGSTSIGLTGCSGTPPTNGIIFLKQCDNNFSGATCTTGALADNGGIYVCGDQVGCMRPNECVGGVGTCSTEHQYQVVYATNVTGSAGNFTVTISDALHPGSIYMPNWNSARSPTATWNASTTYGAGLENMTLLFDSSLNANMLSIAIDINFTYGSWIKGVRIIGSGPNTSISVKNSKNFLTTNTYQYNEPSLTGPFVYSTEGGTSDDLFMNNIVQAGYYLATGSESGDVFAYNHLRDIYTNETTQIMEHDGGSELKLYEGNIAGGYIEDDTHGTHDFSTLFRNYSSGVNGYPYNNLNEVNIDFGFGNRFSNFVGNVLGNNGTNVSKYEQVEGSGYNWIYGFNAIVNVASDPLVKTTSFRWANIDTLTGSTRFCGPGAPGFMNPPCSNTSEVPTVLSGNAAPFTNTVPASTALPPSFFLPTTAHPSGGTGLSWWKTCVSWTSFPTTCASYTTSPFPAIGSDITAATSFEGGVGMGDHVNDIPATLAFRHLPIDTTYQSTYCIASSSFASGTVTLNLGTNAGCPGGALTSFPSSPFLLGPFRVTGGCSSAGGLNGEFYMSNSTTTSVSYIGSNPGSCAGSTILFPDVRQFDERVYQLDSSGPSTPTVTTTSATSITNTTATIGGNVTSDGGASVTARGLASGTSDPGTAFGCSGSGTGTGTFTSNLTGLTAGTLYYFRACATNSVGTSYSSVSTFTTTGGTVATPTDSPGQGTYSSAQSVTLSDATGGATICYTLNGSTPGATTPGTCNAGSTTYSGAFSISSTTTVKAIGTLSGSTNSGVLSSTYTITTPPAGSFASGLTGNSGFTGSAGIR